MNIQKIFKSAWKYISDSDFRFRVNAMKFHLYDKMSDRKMIEKLYVTYFGRKLDLDNPITFNEKLQWLKLYDHKIIYTTMVDKYEAKKFVADRIGSEYIIPTIGVWETFDEINFDSFPDQFVLKCTHDSGGIIICRDKKLFNKEEARKILEKSLNTNFYLVGREWPYKNVKPRIIAEKYMVDEVVSELRDYKFFCFNGVCRCLKVDFDRFVEHHANYYDPQGNMIGLGEIACPPDKQRNINLPSNKDKMIEFAEKLSQTIPFLRVDFYDVNGKIYFGELTFYPASGFGIFTDEEWDYKLGNWLELPQLTGRETLL